MTTATFVIRTNNKKFQYLSDKIQTEYEIETN